MALTEATKWRPASNTVADFGNEHEHYMLVRQSGFESEAMGPHYLHWEDAIVGGAIVNGHVTREAIIEYANGFADKDSEIMDEALNRIAGNVRLLRQFGWQVPDPALETAAPAP